MRGVWRTRVGYAGGKTADPTYRNIGDHAEALEIDYDPRIISFEDILWKFWRGHNPARKPWSRQYMSAVFYHNDVQKETILATAAQHAADIGMQIQTEIAPAVRFYMAEDYHQKYTLQSQQILMRELRQIYPNFDDFINSTAAARLNGFMSGYGQLDLLEDEIGQYGLTESAQDAVRRNLTRWRG